MHQIAPLIIDLTIMLGLAAIVTLLFQRIRQPVVLGYLVAGMILGPYTPPHALVSDMANIRILSELGVIFLMFSLGLEFSFHKLLRVGFSASITGLVEVILMTIIGYGAGRIIGWNHYNSLFLGAALSISSTTIIIKAIDELKLKTKRFAEIVFGVLIVEDLLAILILVALSTVILTQNVFSGDMAYAVAKLILVVGSWFLCGYFLVPPLMRQVARYINQETLTILSVALCLFLVSIAAYFDYSTALGAFIMGSILAETVFVHRIEELIRPIRDIFAAVFFISVGMLVNPFNILHQWPIVLFLAVVTVFGKMFTTSVAALLTGQSLTTSVRVGCSMAQVGEFSFIIVGLAVALAVANDALYPVIVAVSIVTTFTTPYLIRLSGQISTLLEKKLPERTRYFLASYSAWVFRSQSSGQKKPLWRMVTIRLILNGIIVAIIFTLIHQVVFPQIFLTMPSMRLAKNLSLLIAIVLASPFIWGMLFAYKRANLPDYAKMYLNPAIFIIWLITLTEIALLSLFYFHTLTVTIVLIILAILFFVISYRHLEKSYHWFERQLVKNVKTKGVKLSQYENLAPWDTHFVEIEVGEKSRLAGKTLHESRVRQRYGINIVAIYRWSKAILAPRGEEKIFPHDKLVILGTDEQIDSFKKDIEITAHVEEEENFFENFSLKTLLLKPNHPLIGTTIHASKIRESVNGIVVGLERDNVRILNPDAEIILQVDDLLFIVGEASKIKRLKKFLR